MTFDTCGYVCRATLSYCIVLHKVFSYNVFSYKVFSDKDCKLLQDDLNSLSAWSKQWLMKFNEDKCVVLKIRASLDYIYTLNGTRLEEVQEQRDLEVIINNKLTPSSHIKNITSKASQRLFMIKRCFTGLTNAKLSTLYSSIIRLVLEYASITWNPWLRKDISAIDSVQRK